MADSVFGALLDTPSADHDASFERDSWERRNLAYMSYKPTQIAEIMINDSPNLVQGLTMQNVFAAPYVEPVFWLTNATYVNPPMGSHIPYSARGSDVDAQQMAGVKEIQALLIGGP